MKLKFFIPALVSVALAAACAKNAETPAPKPDGEVRIRAGITAVSTRTWLDSGSGESVLPVYWSDGDRINVNGQNSAPVSLGSAAGQSEAEFLLRSVIPPYNAIYPAEIISSDTYSQGSIEISIPSTQGYVPGSFGSGAAILYGYSESEDAALAMQNLCAAIRVKLRGDASVVIEDARLNSATTPVAGRYTLKPQDGTLSVIEGTNDLSLDLGEGVALSPEGSWFYFTVPAGEYADSLVFSFIQKSDRRAMRCKWTPADTLRAGVLYSFSNVEYVPGAKDIETPDDWNEFAACVNEGGDMRKWLRGGAVHLAADLTADDLTKVKGRFTWVFDGQGHTITRSNGSGALFRNVHGTVKNLNLDGVLTSTATCVSALADTLYDGGRIEYCNNAAAVTVDAATYGIAGGIAAIATGGVISHCNNSGAISVSVDCSAETQFNLQAAGIVGQVNTGISGMPCGDFLVEYCNNSGAIAGNPICSDSNNGITYAAAAGIVAWLRGTNHSYTIDHCGNTGSIDYKGDRVYAEGMAYSAVFVGGIAGIACDMSNGYPKNNDGLDVSIRGCSNLGQVHNCGINVSTGAQNLRHVFTGGIAGGCMGTSSKHASIISCKNRGKLLTYDLTGDSSYAYPEYCQVVGGLVGFGGFVDIDSCYVNCTIGNGKRACNSIGGIIGHANRTFSVSNSKVWFTLYFTRINAVNHINTATVAVAPMKYGTSSNSAQLALDGSTVSNNALKGNGFYFNTTTGSKADDSSNCKTSFSISNSTSNMVRGNPTSGNTEAAKVSYSGNTALTEEPEE